MKTFWTITTYVRAELPLTDNVLPVMSFTLLVEGDTPPSPELVQVLVERHTRNCEPLMSELDKNEVDDDGNFRGTH